MSATVVTPETVALRELIELHRSRLSTLLAKYGAVNARLFGSVARGEAGPNSDIDILVDLLPDHPHSPLIRVSGLIAEARAELGHEVDIFTPQLMKALVSESALQDAVAL